LQSEGRWGEVPTFCRGDCTVCGESGEIKGGLRQVTEVDSIDGMGGACQAEALTENYCSRIRRVEVTP